TLLAAMTSLSAAGALGCVRKPDGQESESSQRRGEYRGPLVDPTTIPGDFLWEQRVTAYHGERKGAFDAVVQKRGPELLILGLTPMKPRGFSLTQRRSEFTYKQYVPFELPFSPASVLYDVHRCFFHELLDSFPESGSRKRAFAKERLIDEFEGSRLTRRTYENVSGSGMPLTIQYGPPGYGQGVPPRIVSLNNKAYGYRLTVTTSATHQL